MALNTVHKYSILATRPTTKPGDLPVPAVRSIPVLEATSGPLTAVWRGQALASRSGPVLASGHAALDAQLPGGGWPLDAMVELLQPSAGQPFWQLLLPALVQSLGQQRGPVVLVAPPHAPFSPALAAQGLEADRLLCIRAERPAERLWATEQALRCADVPAVLAWLPHERQVRDDAMRRLQLAGSDRPRLLFALRPQQAEADGSPARLRLALKAEGDSLQVRIVKRRGPPCEQPITVPARATRLQALLGTRGGPPAREAPTGVRSPQESIILPGVAGMPAAALSSAAPVSLLAARGVAHALDRTSAA
ncbi:MAG: translesion DNA synthesis-associated protein ImuA [Burkholderiaceae bacterium]|nr:translesion DNA synthesis-associated protein ImuA [Burkholderiaceae bacterium]